VGNSIVCGWVHSTWIRGFGLVIISYVHIKEFSEHITMRTGESRVMNMKQSLQNPPDLFVASILLAKLNPRKLDLGLQCILVILVKCL